MSGDITVSESTEAAPRFIDGSIEVVGDLRLTRRFYVYRVPDGLVSATTFNVRFMVDATTSEVWPIFKDLTLWQRSHHRYSGAVGDLEGKSFQITDELKAPGKFLGAYEVVRVIPEHLMVVSQPAVPGGVSPGFHVFMLSPHDRRTDVNIQMQHAKLDRDWSEQEALAPWRELAPRSLEKWRDSFVPTLKRLVRERRA